MSKPTLKALSVLLLCTVVYYWKILLTRDYSILIHYEGLTHLYTWLTFWIMGVRDGILPLWDPYALAGHPFAGEMQTAAFYPLHLLLVLFPFNREGVLSLQLFHQWFALTHFLGACFMYALARDLGLRRFPSVIAGMCYSMGGLLGGVEFLNWVDAAIWLPLVFLFLLRALRAETTRRAALHGCLSGLSLGLAILAGGLHISMMEALVVTSAVVFAALHPQLRQKGPLGRAWIRPAMILAVVAVVAFCAGAVQLLVSMEYNGHVLRFFGAAPPLPPGQRIPSSYPSDGLWPHGFLGLLIRYGFGGQMGGGEVLPMYMGVFPVLAAVIGVWKRWDKPWVRYLAGLAVVAFLYALGDLSAVYGFVRTLVPYLWMAREANRFIFMAQFALAILAAFGVEAMLYGPRDESAWRPLTRVLTWIVVACAVAQAIPALFEHPGMNLWVSLSILLIFASCGLYRYIIGGHTGTAVRGVMVALILFDLTTFNWFAGARTATDAWERALSCRGPANFLKSLPGRFRLHIATDDPPPVGDLFRVPAVTGGLRATVLQDYLALVWKGRTDLLNARYILKPASASEPGDVYHDSKWKIYENPKSFPAAWMVHRAIVEPSPERLLSRLDSPEIDLHQQALLEAPLESAIEPRAENASEDVKFGACGPNRLELTVRAESSGLLVLSEIFYPGWRAAVNGNPGRIYKVDGALRGVVVPRGESRIVLRYVPGSFWLGAFLTLTAFSGTLLAAFLTWRNSRRPDQRGVLPAEPPPAA